MKASDESTVRLPRSLHDSPATNALIKTAAIFDFDGTLVDSMPLHYRAYAVVFANAGLELSEEDFYSNIGGAARETIPRFLRGRPCALSVEEIHAQKKRELDRLLETAPLTMLETSKLLPILKASMKVGLASSGSRRGIEKMLARLAWTAHFDAVVTGEDAARGKPAPDLFIECARRLGVAPAHCIVFEDTDDGVAAAIAAGMEVFDVRRTSTGRIA